VQGFASGYGMSLVWLRPGGGGRVRGSTWPTRSWASRRRGSSYFLPRFAGIKRALEIFFTGDFMDAQEAQRLGIVNRVAPDAELEQATLDLARKLAKGPPLAMAEAKKLVYGSLSETLERQLEDEREAIQRSAATQDFNEGVSAFLEKRKANFQGR
jgi:2-(1,2-epoxy-1,2-dihydrophenyl)acetyl-CoA isomerase